MIKKTWVFQPAEFPAKRHNGQMIRREQFLDPADLPMIFHGFDAKKQFQEHIFCGQSNAINLLNLGDGSNNIHKNCDDLGLVQLLSVLHIFGGIVYHIVCLENKY